ncbi:Pyridoxamine 5'-phosphate oxidase [Nakaseomyces glabratus]
MAPNSHMAPWVPMFTQSCKNVKQAFIPFQFATVAESVDGIPLPKCRTVVFRDFLFDERKTNVLTFNTDLRSNKVEESFPNGNGTCLFEACFYFHETWEQYRFTGECFLVSRKQQAIVSNETLLRYGIVDPTTFKRSESNSSVSSCSSSDEGSLPAMVDSLKLDDSKYDNHHDDGEEDIHNTDDGKVPLPTDEEWQQEIMRQWDTLSRATKSVYKKPAPGEPITEEMKKKIDKIERGVDGSKADYGLDNFAIVCLCIDKVDNLNLKGGKGGARWIFERVIDETGFETWEEQEVCP